MKIFLISILLFSCISLYAEKDYIVKYVGRNEGLSNSAVLNIFQDENGILWFGTYDGLNCYDGKTMDVYRTLSEKDKNRISFNSNIIHKMCQADNHCLWIKTYLGITRFSQTSHKIEKVYHNTQTAKIYSNIKGNTWIVNNDSLFYYNTKIRDFIYLDKIYYDMDKVEGLVGNDGQLYLLPSEDMNIINYTIKSFSMSDSLSLGYEKNILSFHDKKVTSFFVQGESFSFIDSEGNMFLYDISRKSKIFIQNVEYLCKEYGEVANILSLHDDIIIAFKLNGLIRLNSSKGYIPEILSRSIRVFSAIKDNNNDILWIGSDGDGVIMISKNNSIASCMMLSDVSPYLNRQVRCISTDRYGGLWFGTKGDGLLYISEYEKYWCNKKKIRHFMQNKEDNIDTYLPTGKDSKIYSIKEGKYNEGMWIGGGIENLLSFYSFDLKKIIPVVGFSDGSEIQNIYEYDKYTLFITSSHKGLYKLSIDPGNNQITIKDKKYYEIKDKNNIVLRLFYSMEVVGDSIIWLGDRGRGIVRFDIKNESYKTISLKEYIGKSVDDVLSIKYYGNDKYYIGTSKGVVSMVYKNDEIEKINYIGYNEGLSNEMIHGILIDKDSLLWMSSNKGLNKYNTINGSMHTFRNNGIDIVEFSDGAFYKCPYSGRLFFGGNNGLLYLHKNTNIVKEFYPDIILRKFNIENNIENTKNYEKNGVKGWSFDVSNSFFEFYFVAPDYLNGDNIEFSYKLEGYDDEWSRFSGKNSALYVNVPVGEYEFKVKYKRDINEANSKMLTVPIRISVPWYHSNLFTTISYILMILSGMYIEFLFVRRKYRNNILTSVQDKDSEINENETLEYYGVIFTIQDEEHKKFIEKLIKLIENNLSSDELSIPFLSSELCLSPRQFYRKFNAISSSVSPSELIKLCRLSKAIDLLKNTDMPIQEICICIGFNSRSYFYKEFVNKYGVTPKDYRNNKYRLDGTLDNQT